MKYFLPGMAHQFHVWPNWPLERNFTWKQMGTKNGTNIGEKSSYFFVWKNFCDFDSLESSLEIWEEMPKEVKMLVRLLVMLFTVEMPFHGNAASELVIQFSQAHSFQPFYTQASGTFSFVSIQTTNNPNIS